ncbi:hypothetical protein CY35_18G102500 [Sphagnum magellanicum]|jgi:hypothetical protein|nr:hypothetical protein CY35_18G091200 [Sphagnum magellanicum]KAH9534327.1 hypothetical protein CY35_18G102400 [Sphagnum magellanicum]KAH9534328.1 hypothetical protein CY35_18G102500 [Sphagnum magellanicum]
MASLHEADSEYVHEDERSDHNASRNIRVSVDDTNATSTFKVVEETNWNEATWREIEGPPYTLIVNGSDVSGTLRFKGPVPAGSEYPEFFLVALGIDTDTWCDLKVDLALKETGAFFQPKYFHSGTPEFKVKQDHQKTVTKTFTASGIIVTVTITNNLLVVSWE